MTSCLRYFWWALALLAGCTVYPGGHAPPATGAAPRPAVYRTVAVLPIRVLEVRLRGFTQPGAPDTSARRQQRGQRRSQKLAYQLQAALATQLRARQPPQHRTLLLQDPAETNRRLERAGLTYDSLPAQPLARLQQLLGVDALLTGQTTVARVPLSVELTTNVLLSKPGLVPSLLTTTHLTLQDARAAQPAWQTSFSSSETDSLIPGSPAELAAKLLRALPATFPY